MIKAIFEQELQRQLRNKTGLVLFILMLLLLSLSAITHWHQDNTYKTSQEHWQQVTNDLLLNQPDRHPHRAAHYGHVVFRKSSPLSFLDAGVTPFVGNFLFLEAHRQNSTAIKSGSFSAGQMALGYPSVSTLIFVVWPLVLIALAYNCISDDRENGRLKWLSGLRVSMWLLAFGRSLVYVLISLLLTLFVGTISCYLILTSGESGSLDIWLSLVLILMSYMLYSVLWLVFIVGASAISRANKNSLTMLLSLWIVSAVAIPKLTSSVAETLYPIPDRVLFEKGLHKAVHAVGDSHNPNDPYFNDYKQKVLKDYGVDSVDELPVNWKGLLMAEGERITAAIYNEHIGKINDTYRQHAQIHAVMATLSPTLMMTKLSQTLAGNDRETFNNFEKEAEQYRYDLIKTYNTIHAEEVTAEQDKGSHRVSHEYFEDLILFDYELPKTLTYVSKQTELLAVALWWLLVTGLMLVGIRKQEFTL